MFWSPLSVLFVIHWSQCLNVIRLYAWFLPSMHFCTLAQIHNMVNRMRTQSNAYLLPYKQKHLRGKEKWVTIDWRGRGRAHRQQQNSNSFQLHQIKVTCFKFVKVILIAIQMSHCQPWLILVYIGSKILYFRNGTYN